MGAVNVAERAVGASRRVLVIEDDPLTRGLLADMLERSGFEVATASTAGDASRAARLLDPDALVVDINLGIGPNGFDVADALTAAQPGLSVLFLTSLPDARFGGRDPSTLPEGAGYLRKERLSEPGTLVSALDAVLRGTVTAEHRHDLDPGRPMGALSRTQIDVLRMLAMGLSNQQIAEARGTTPRAVRNVVARALAAIGESHDEEGAARVKAARNFMLAAGIPMSEPPAS